eukprot:3529291-Rhodomonas_salina.2
MALPGTSRRTSHHPEPSGTKSTICLRACYAVSGTDVVYVLSAYARAARCQILTCCTCYLPTHVLCDVRYYPRACAICGSLRVCYAMSGTELLHGVSTSPYDAALCL